MVQRALPPAHGMNAPSQIAYLQHARDALLSVREYTATGRDGFFGSKMVQDAVVRNLEIIGEAVKALAPKLVSSPRRQTRPSLGP